MLAPVTLRSLETAGFATRNGRIVWFDISSDWCAPGENRIGYATLVRLIECVRELHWEIDIEPCCDGYVDSITRELHIGFTRPVLSGRRIEASYMISWFRQRSYGLSISLVDTHDGTEAARAEVAFIFWDPESRAAVAPPDRLAMKLRSLASGTE